LEKQIFSLFNPRRPATNFCQLISGDNHSVGGFTPMQNLGTYLTNCFAMVEHPD
jgi:hypothetical protein